jgi:eukaryotic-like serine/threonine-protein kinase
MAETTIGHYTIVSELGRGGMGVVYKAHEESLNRFVAIKLLSDQLSEDPTFVARFVREAQAAAALSHPNIIQIFYIGEDKGRHYFVMEYVSGKSLLGMVRAEGKIDNPRAAQFMLQAANGLAAAHDKGFLHRDIKPANLMVDDRGLLKIADFGLALPADASTRLTATGMLMGTPGYLSPEQCRGETLDLRTDIYSLGVTYYELLTGRVPFQADSPLALLHKILQEEAPDIVTLSKTVDADTRRIVHRMIAKDRGKRYQDCHELAADLERLLQAQGVPAATGGVAGMAGALAQQGRAPAAAAGAEDGPTHLMDSGGQRPAPAPPTDPTAPMANLPPAAASPEVSTRPAAVPIATAVAPAAPGVAPALVGAPSAMVPAPQAAPVPVEVAAPAARRSSAPLVILTVVVVLLVALGVSGYMALRSPLVQRYAPWLSFARTAKKTDAAPSQTVPPPASESTASAADTGNAPPPAAGGEQPSSQPVSAASGSVPIPSAGGASSAGAPSSLASRPRHPAAVSRPESAVAGGSHPGAMRRERRPAEAAAGGVAFAVVGDPALAGPVSSLLASELESAGLQAVDAASLPAAEDVLRPGGEPSSGELLRALGGVGVGVLVVARVQHVGERMLSYMGRQDVATSSRVTVTCYDVASGRPRGRPLAATVEYTALNAESAAQKALGSLLQEAAQQAR